MVIGEGQRRALHQRLVEVLGVDEADVLMEHLPPSGWGDVARRSDLEHLQHVLRAEFRGEIAMVRVDLADMRAEMADLRAELTDKIAAQTRTVMIGMASMVVALVGSMTGAFVAFGR